MIGSAPNKCTLGAESTRTGACATDLGQGIRDTDFRDQGHGHKEPWLPSGHIPTCEACRDKT